MEIGDCIFFKKLKTEELLYSLFNNIVWPICSQDINWFQWPIYICLISRHLMMMLKHSNYCNYYGQVLNWKFTDVGIEDSLNLEIHGNPFFEIIDYILSCSFLAFSHLIIIETWLNMNQVRFSDEYKNKYFLIICNWLLFKRPIGYTWISNISHGEEVWHPTL